MQPTHPRFLIGAIGVFSFSLVAVGVAMAQFLNLAACPLCIWQRIFYLLVALFAAIGFALAAHGNARRVFAFLMVIAAGCGLFVAGYQVWIQRFSKAATCGMNEPWWETVVYWLGEQIPLLFGVNGLCSDPAWKFLSLSIADWSTLLFSGILAGSLAAALMRGPIQTR